MVVEDEVLEEQEAARPECIVHTIQRFIAKMRDIQLVPWPGLVVATRVHEAASRVPGLEVGVSKELFPTLSVCGKKPE